MNHLRFLSAALFLVACSSGTTTDTSGTAAGGGGGNGGDVKGDGATTKGFAGNWVANPYKWNVKCSNKSGSLKGGSTSMTENISKYRIDVSGSTLRMYVTDQEVNCVQVFSIDGGKAKKTKDEGTCSWHVKDGPDNMGTRSTETDELVLSADGKSFDEVVKYKVVYDGDYECAANDSGTWVRDGSTNSSPAPSSQPPGGDPPEGF